MKINVYYMHFQLRELIKIREEEIVIRENSKLVNLLEYLIKKYDVGLKEIIFSKNKEKLKVLIQVNGTVSTDLSATLKNKDKIVFMPLITGG